jgi:hypothetical protein
MRSECGHQGSRGRTDEAATRLTGGYSDGARMSVVVAVAVVVGPRNPEAAVVRIALLVELVP